MSKVDVSGDSSLGSIEMDTIKESQQQQIRNTQELENAKTKSMTISLIKKSKPQEIFEYYKNTEILPQEKIWLLYKVYNDDDAEQIAYATSEEKITSSLPQCCSSILNYVPIFYPNSIGLLIWKGFIGILIIFYFYEIPIYISFDKDVWDFIPEWGRILILVVSLISFVLDMNLDFHTAYYAHGNLVLDREKIALRYLHSQFLYDLIAILTLFIRSLMQTYYFRLIYLLFYLKFFSLQKISFQFGEIVMLHRGIRTVFQISKVLCVLQFLFILYACAWYSTCLYATNQGYTSWLTYEGNFGTIQDKSQIEKFFYAYYFSIGTTTTTMGYGDMSPLNYLEVLLGMAGILFAVLVFAVMVNLIFKILEEYSISDVKQFQQQLSINKYMMMKDVPQDVRERVRQYLNEHWYNQGYRDTQLEKEIIDQLAPELRAELKLSSCGKLLLQIPLFCTNFSRGFLRELSNVIQEQSFSEKEFIFIGQDSQYLDDFSIYFINIGEVIIIPNNIRKFLILKKLIKGEYFGEYSFLTGFERKATVQAIQYSQLYKISRNDFLNTLLQFSEDYEKYWMIKDRLEFEKDYASIGVCYTCQSTNHYSTECDVTHLVLTDKTFSDNNQCLQPRKKFRRKIKPKWQTFIRIECFKKHDHLQKLAPNPIIKVENNELIQFQKLLHTNFEQYQNQYEIKNGLEGMDQAFQFTTYFTQQNYDNNQEFVNTQVQTKLPNRISMIQEPNRSRQQSQMKF